MGRATGTQATAIRTALSKRGPPARTKHTLDGRSRNITGVLPAVRCHCREAGQLLLALRCHGPAAAIERISAVPWHTNAKAKPLRRCL